MGFLAPVGMALAPELGAMLGGAGASAGTAAAASMGASALGTAASMGGSLLSGISGYQQNMFQAKLADYNYQLVEQQKNTTLEAGSIAQSEKLMATGKLVGEEKASQGAGGTDVGGGSNVGVRQSTELAGQYDASTIRFNAAKQAYDLQQQAFSDQLQSKQSKNAAIGSLVGGILGMGTNFVSGAASVSDKYAQYLTTGALTVPGSGAPDLSSSLLGPPADLSGLKSTTQDVTRF